MGTDIGTPSVKTGFTKDIYLTLEKAAPAGATEAQVKIFIKPLILWMWIGGALMAIGTVLAAFPGKRRVPTAPTSAPVVTDLPPEPADEDVHV
jgi:cytochrome c-type biogenesis protein CcmF